MSTYGELEAGDKVAGPLVTNTVVAVDEIDEWPSMVRVTYDSGWIEARGKEDEL